MKSYGTQKHCFTVVFQVMGDRKTAQALVVKLARKASLAKDAEIIHLQAGNACSAVEKRSTPKPKEGL